MYFVCLPTATSWLSLFLAISTVAKTSLFPFFIHSDFISSTSPALIAFRYLYQRGQNQGHFGTSCFTKRLSFYMVDVLGGLA